MSRLQSISWPYHIASTSPPGPDERTAASFFPNVSSRLRHFKLSQDGGSTAVIATLEMRVTALQYGQSDRLAQIYKIWRETTGKHTGGQSSLLRRLSDCGPPSQKWSLLTYVQKP